MHLVDAYYTARDYGNTIRHARGIDQSYFDDEDLHWRSVKVTENPGRVSSHAGKIGRRAGTRQVCLRSAGDPRRHRPRRSGLPHRARAQGLDMVSNSASDRARVVGCEILTDISSTIELRRWFPESIPDQIFGALQNCSEQRSKPSSLPRRLREAGTGMTVRPYNFKTATFTGRPNYLAKAR